MKPGEIEALVRSAKTPPPAPLAEFEMRAMVRELDNVEAKTICIKLRVILRSHVDPNLKREIADQRRRDIASVAEAELSKVYLRRAEIADAGEGAALTIARICAALFYRSTAIRCVMHHQTVVDALPEPRKRTSAARIRQSRSEGE